MNELTTHASLADTAGGSCNACLILSFALAELRTGGVGGGREGDADVGDIGGDRGGSGKGPAVESRPIL